MSDQGQSPGNYGDDRDTKDQILENPLEKRIKIQSERGIDWISKLPDVLIIQILSLLPLKDTFRTSNLSKRWQYLWTYIDNVNFKCLRLNKFISVTDNVLPRLSCSNIKKFSLSFDFSDNDASACSSKVDKWVEVAVNKNVEDLELDVWLTGQYYNLPQVLCTSSSITKLECVFCVLSEDCVLNWTSLQSLTLSNLFIRDEHIEQISSSCPQLESLKVVEFCGLHRLHITSPKCRRLELSDHWHPNRDWWSFVSDCGYVEIVAPYVQHLKIAGLYDGLEIRLGDLSSLVHANLTFTTSDCLRKLDEEIDKTLVINNLLPSLRCATELTVPSWLIEVISMLMFEKEDASLPLLECKRLTINFWITKFSFLGIASLLRSTPYLENMRVLPELDYSGVNLINNFVSYWDEDFDLSEDKYLSLQRNLFKGSLQNLKNIKVISKFCRPIYKAGKRALSQLLKLLLEHAINLEKLVITPEHRECYSCPTNMSKMIEKLSAFPRASNSAIFSVGSVSDVDFLE